jgi:hypothetical protein
MIANNIKVIYSDLNNIIKNFLVEKFNKTVANLLQNIRIFNPNSSSTLSIGTNIY